MKILSIFWAMTMGLFALVQMNDPDALLWSGAYLLCCGIWLAEFYQRRWWWLNVSVMLVLVFWMGTLSPALDDWVASGSIGDIFGAPRFDQPHTEAALEFFGLALAAGSLGYLVLRDRIAT